MKKRMIALLLAAVLLVGACPAAGAASLPDGCQSQEWEVLKLVNRERIAEGLAPLSTYGALQAIADVRAAELVSVFDHIRPDGTSCFTAYSVPYLYAGENIAAGYDTPDYVMYGWMNSPSHRDNILTSCFTHLGVGYVATSTDYRHYWSQNFIGSECKQSNLRLADAKELYILKQGQTLESLDLILCEDCSIHGTTYLPVIDEMCSKIDSTSTKVQTVTITAGSQTVTVQVQVSPFVDVDGSRFYAEPVIWAVENGITNGIDKTHFAPQANCTRAQVVTFLYRAVGSPEQENTHFSFVDVSPGSFSYKATLWAAEYGITTGVDSTHFAPDATVTRAQFVTFLYRLCGKPETSGTNPFTDLNADAFYYDAVLWAYENGITSGISATQFAPNAPCTRGQVVSFLYRMFH